MIRYQPVSIISHRRLGRRFINRVNVIYYKISEMVWDTRGYLRFGKQSDQ